jgi:nicotinamide mononucleotide (NMN) deamidase PncC
LVLTLAIEVKAGSLWIAVAAAGAAAGAAVKVFGSSAVTAEGVVCYSV